MNVFDTAFSPIFCDISYFKKDYIPPQLSGRDVEIKLIINAYRPIFRNDYPSNLLLFGKPGTGKNITSAYVIKQLEENTKKHDHEVIKLRVSCERTKTNTAVLRELIRQAKGDRDLPDSGLGLHDYSNMFSKIFDNNSKQLVIVWLDEIDHLESDSILHTLSRANETGLLKENTKLSIIATTNDFNYTKQIASAIASSLNLKKIMFTPYKENQLIEILNDRRAAFIDGAVDNDVIELCSRLSAKKHGDSRLALKLFKDAGYAAEEKGSSKVKKYHVIETYYSSYDSYIGETIKNLPETEKTVLLAVVQLSKPDRKYGVSLIKTGEVVSRQNKIANKLKTEHLSKQDVSQILNDLKLNQLISLRKDKSGRGNTRIVELDEELKYQIDKVEEMLKKSLPTLDAQMV